jgi:serine/threonine protein kinase
LHLTDFGTAKNISDKERISSDIEPVKGTIDYLAPEILNAKSEKPTI